MSYKVFFEDGTIFKGGSVENSKWNEMPDKFITKLEYEIGGHKLIFKGYDGYNHLVEWMAIVNKPDRKKALRVLLMARKNKHVLIIERHLYPYWEKFNFSSGIFGKELRGAPTTGWKKGITSGKPEFQKI